MISSHKGGFSYWYEDENGDNPLKISGEICFDGDYFFTPEEKMVLYYPDGSGYPGCPAEIELTDFVATKIDDQILTKEQGKIVGEWLETVFNNPSLEYDLKQHIGEEISDAEEFALEQHADEMRERMLDEERY